MNRQIHPINRQETEPPLTLLSILCLPVVMVIAGLVRVAARAGIIRFPAPVPETPPRILGLYKNRYFRRARAACIRKEYSLIKQTGKPMTALNYFPRRYAFLSFGPLATGGRGLGHYLEEYAQSGGVSRAQVFGLSAAHYVVAVLPEAFTLYDKAGQAAPGMSLGALSDPAPP